MKVKKVNRYYCDHCKQGKCSKSAMVLHEGRCIRNPDRICGFCRTAEIEQKPMAELVKNFRAGDIDSLRLLTNGCPACMLAAIV